MHLPLVVHRHPGPSDDPDHQELHGSDLSHPRATRVAHNLTRSTALATELEVAGTLWTKFLGLMGRAELPASAGLWLPGSNGIHMMFMRFPIDAIFLAAPAAPVGEVAGEVRPVVACRPGLRAWTGLVPFVRGAHGVLELPVGTIAASRTEAGDLVRLG